MRTRIIEIVVGLFIVAAIGALFFLAIKVSGLSDETFLKEGDEITDTQSSLVLEDLIGKFLSSKVNEPAPAAE